MNEHQKACVIILGLGAAIAVYYAMANDGQDEVPAVQGEGQVMGMGVAAGMRTGIGTCLDLRPEVHFWSPGTNPRDKNPPCGVVTTPHRYPALPGGNISTVMHRGWSQFCQSAPADDDWRLNPPEVAVL